MRKRVLLTAVMGLLLGAQPMFPHDFVANGLGYAIISENEAEVTPLDDGETYSGPIDIPATVTHNGMAYRVTRIGADAFRGSWVSRVNLPESLVEICDGGFEDCTILREIVLPEGLGRIGRRVFQGCCSLVSLNLPTPDLEISWDAFIDTGLRAVAFNFTSAPEFDMLCLSVNELPSVVTFPAESSEVFRNWCPDLFDGRSELSLTGNDILPVWLYPGIFSEDDGAYYLPAGLLPRGASEMMATVTDGKDITLLYPMLAGMPLSILVDGTPYKPNPVIIPSDTSFGSPTDLFSASFEIRLEDMHSDTEVSVLAGNVSVGHLREDDEEISYDIAGDIITAHGSIHVHDLTGRRVAEGVGSVSTSGLPSGIYTVITSGGSRKILIR